MDVWTAWRTFGRDFGAIAAEAKSKRRSERLTFLEGLLEEAKRARKSLLAKHHPDRGGDPSTFRRVEEAYQVIERETEQFRASFASSEARREAERAEKQSVRIEIDPID
jgi:hypothetical protein